MSELLRTVENGRPWDPAERGVEKVLVWRRDARVYYRDLEDVEADALEAVERGVTFAEVCDIVAAHGGIEDPIAAMNRMLARWLSDGLLTQ